MHSFLQVKSGNTGKGRNLTFSNFSFIKLNDFINNT